MKVFGISACGARWASRTRGRGKGWWSGGHTRDPFSRMRLGSPVRVQKAQTLAAERESRRRRQQSCRTTANHREIQELLKLEEALFRSMQRTRGQLLSCLGLRGCAVEVAFTTFQP